MGIVNYLCRDCGAFLYAKDIDGPIYGGHLNEYQKNCKEKFCGRCQNCWQKYGDFWAIEWAPAYGIEILRATHPQKGLEEYAIWYRYLVLHGLGSHLELPHLQLDDLPKDPADGSFPGCDNYAWIITEKEKAEYIRLNNERAEAKAKAQAQVEAEAERKFLEALQKARATGEPQVLDSWVTQECTENLPDCSFDAAVKLVFPDGKIKIEYSHCH